MFEVGFSELVLIFGLALIVLGPQRLPKLAAQIGRWVGRARAMARQFREQLDQEVSLEETAGRKASPVTPPAAATPVDPAPDTQSPHERTGP
jgi:Tat protein translocase TatB subunit